MKKLLRLRNFFLLGSFTLLFYLLLGMIRSDNDSLILLRFVIAAILGLVVTVYAADPLTEYATKMLPDTTSRFKSSKWWTTVATLLTIGIYYVTITGDWLGPLFLIPVTVSIIMIFLYVIAYKLAKRDKWWTGGKTESIGIVHNNGVLVEVLVFSEAFHTNKRQGPNAEKDPKQRKWEIVLGQDSKTWLEKEVNARWMGPTWNHKLLPLTLRCHKWVKSGDYIEHGTVVKTEGHQNMDYIGLFHTHAYVTDEIEIKGNIQVRAALSFRFRITNAPLVFFRSGDIMEMLQGIANGVAVELWAKLSFEKLKESKFETANEDEKEGEREWKDLTKKEQRMMGYIMMYAMNRELVKYGLKIVDIHKLDLQSSDEIQRKALAALEVSNLLGQAKVNDSIFAAQGTLIELDAQAEGKANIATKLMAALDNDPEKIRAFAMTQWENVQAIGTGVVLPLEDRSKDKKKVEPTTPTTP